MHQLRRAMMIFVFAALIFGSNSVSYANDWYVPKAMTSVDAAITSINELKGFVVAKTDYSVQTQPWLWRQYDAKQSGQPIRDASQRIWTVTPGY